MYLLDLPTKSYQNPPSKKSIPLTSQRTALNQRSKNPPPRLNFSKMNSKHLNELDDDIAFHHHHMNGHRSDSCDAIEEVDEETDLDLDLAASANGQAAASTEERKAAALRIIKRVKRDRAYSTSEGSHFAPTAPGSGTGQDGKGSRVAKNSRKSRSGFGRGLPKKGGAGGKGTWGKLGCELELPWIDPNDPNYESDSEKADSPKAINGKTSNTDLKALVPEMSEDDVRKSVEPLILEYFENSDSMEVLFTLQEMLPNLGKKP